MMLYDDIARAIFFGIYKKSWFKVFVVHYDIYLYENNTTQM